MPKKKIKPTQRKHEPHKPHTAYGSVTYPTNQGMPLVYYTRSAPSYGPIAYNAILGMQAYPFTYAGFPPMYAYVDSIVRRPAFEPLYVFNRVDPIARRPAFEPLYAYNPIDPRIPSIWTASLWLEA